METLQKNESLTDKKFFVFFSLILVASALVVWFFFNLLYIQQQKIERILEVESVRIESSLKNRIESTFGIAKSMGLQIAKNSNNKNYINNILQKFITTSELNKNFSWTIFSWSDSNYNLVVDAQYGILEDPIKLSIRDYISLTKKQPDQLHLGIPVIGSTSKKWMIPGGVGLIDKDKYLGAVIFGFEIESLARSLYESVQSYNVEFELVGTDKFSILSANSHSSPCNNYFGASKNNNTINDPQISKMIKELESSSSKNSVTSVNLIKNKHGFLLKKLNNLPYFLVLKYDKTALQNNVWRALESRLTEILSMLLASVLLITFVYKREKLQQLKLINLKNIAQKVSAAKTEFLSQSSRDVKSYICNILSLSEVILSKKEKLQKDELELIESIAKNSKDLLSFIEDLLDTNQIETGKLSLAKIENCNLEKLINRIVILNKGLASKNRVSFQLKIDKNLPKLPCDIKKMKQLLFNVITNSIKYSKAKTNISITAKHLLEENKIYLEIANHGIGMSREEIEILLDANGKNIDKSKVAEVDSHNAGIPLVFRLVELHRGRIEIDSKPEIGTKIKLYFDLNWQNN